jgi:hypothetical protein
MPSAPAVGAGPAGSSGTGSIPGAASGVPTGLGRIAAMTAAGLAVLAFLATFLTSFDPGGLLPALVLAGGLTVGVAVLPTAPRTVLPGTVLTVTAALISLQTLAVSDGFDIVVVVLAILTAAAAVVAALSALGIVAGGRPASSAGRDTPSSEDPTRSSGSSGRGGPGGGAPAGADPGPPSGSFAAPGEQPSQRGGHPGGPPQHGAGSPAGPGQRPWAPMSFSPAGRPNEPSGDDPAARTQVVHRTPGPEAASSGPGGATRDPSPSGANPTPTLAAPLTDGRTGPSRGPGRDEGAGARSETGVEGAASSPTTQEYRPVPSASGESSSPRRDEGAATPPSGEPAARSASGASAPDGSGDATPPSGFPRPTGWGAPSDGSGTTPGSAADGRERPGAHEAP